MADWLLINIPGTTQPLDRGDLFEDPLDKALRKAGKLGHVSGGGTSIDEKKGITSCDIEVDVKDVEKALPVIRESLLAAGAPAGTTVTHPESETVRLKFSKGGVKAFAAGKPKKRFRDSCPWTVGEVLAFQLARDKVVLLHLVGVDLSFNAPIFLVLDWCGATVPDEQTIRQLAREPARRVTLTEPYCVFQLKQGERDGSKLRSTRVSVPVSKSIQNSFISLNMAHWPRFVTMLKKWFGIVKRKRTEMLYDDLGFGIEHVHFALWHPPKKPAPNDAVTLFYAYGSTWFRKTDPDRKPQPVTDKLRTSIDQLKAHFKAQDVWVGNFSAKEGFVMIPVHRKKYKSVLPVIAKLAKQHGVSLYDSETDKLY